MAAQRDVAPPVDAPVSARGVPAATVARLPIYLRALAALQAKGTATTSSEQLAEAAGVNSAQLRKDLSFLGSHGTRGVGYDVDRLSESIASALGLHRDWRVMMVGIGNLGHALANYSGFTTRGFQVVALVDADPAVVGTWVAGLQVQPESALEDLVRANHVSIAVIATPATVAQEICDRLVAAGVTSILNFAPCVLHVPDGVNLRGVDLATELQILAFHEHQKASADV